MLYHSDIEGLKGVFVGRRITGVVNDCLYLDNGTVLEVVPNEGGCICGVGDYELTSLATCDNVITNVSVETEGDGSDSYEPDTTYRLFVYAENTKIAAATVEGNDGNGYYGTGFTIVVRDA